MLERLTRLGDEIRHRTLFEGKNFTSGLIEFRPTGKVDPKQIVHHDREVVCYVLRGRGRLRAGGRRLPLSPGTVCHIPRRVPHDFAALTAGKLVIWYALIKAG
ncbi:MAG TPA: cupin domain-containing protein [candidate division Zixibacteria bacterium]|nr:cupin domain-containing protein [candidate division Zixibacteria bacterium]